MKLDVTITESDLIEACKVSCRAVWAACGYEGTWDENCPPKVRERWIREEREALVPALNYLGIVILP